MCATVVRMILHIHKCLKTFILLSNENYPAFEIRSNALILKGADGYPPWKTDKNRLWNPRSFPASFQTKTSRKKDH